jgi:hypothetical protein
MFELQTGPPGFQHDVQGNWTSSVIIEVLLYAVQHPHFQSSKAVSNAIDDAVVREETPKAYGD